MSNTDFDEQFLKLFKAIEGVRSDVSDIKENMVTKDEMYTRLDGIAQRLDIDDSERTAMVAQLDRHEGWIHQLAGKTDTDLAVEA